MNKIGVVVPRWMSLVPSGSEFLKYEIAFLWIEPLAYRGRNNGGPRRAAHGSTHPTTETRKLEISLSGTIGLAHVHDPDGKSQGYIHVEQ